MIEKADRAMTVIVQNHSRTTLVIRKDPHQPGGKSAGFRDGKGRWTKNLGIPDHIPAAVDFGDVVLPGCAGWRGENSAPPAFSAAVLGWAIYEFQGTEIKLNINFDSVSDGNNIKAELAPPDAAFTVEKDWSSESCATAVIIIRPK